MLYLSSRRRSARSIPGLAAVLWALISFAPEPASADVRTEARLRFRTGMDMIAAGQVDAGIAELQAAYDILPHPHVLYNIARAYGEAGRYEEALEWFERYLEGEPPDHEEVRGFVRALEARLAQTQPAHQGPAVADSGEATATEQPATSVASDDEILALEESATQIEALAEATDSDALRQRAASVRRVAEQLRAERAGGTATATTTEVGGGETQTETTAATGGAEALALGEQQQDLYDETVVSASRFAQNPLDAPNATANVTRQDIRLSGLLNPGELVRRTPGAHVMSTGVSDVQIGMRGFNQRLSPRVLTLINGRSIYADPLGANFFFTEPFVAEDIERIEVVRGPASAVYGANAFSGVINILTREPGSDPGTEAHVGVGNMAQVHGQVSNSGIGHGLAYRIGASYDQANRYTAAIPEGSVGRQYGLEQSNIDVRVARANAHLRHTFKPDLYADFQGGFSSSLQVLQATGLAREFQFDGMTGTAMGTLETPWGHLRAFWNRIGGQAYATASPLVTTPIANTVDIEGAFNRRFTLGFDHNLSLGVAYRRKMIEWSDTLDGNHQENHFNGFFQDTMTIADKLILVAGLRIDRHPLLEKLQISPRGAIVIRPTEGQAIRFSVGQAFRTQTFLESYVDLQLPTPVQAIAVHTIGAELEDRVAQDLDSDRILSSEVGYRFAGSNYFDLDFAAYYNVVRNLVILSDLRAYNLVETAAGNGSFGAGSGAFNEGSDTFIAGTTGFVNDPTIYHVIGGEAAARVYPVRGLDLYANYAYNHAVLRGQTARATSDVAPAHIINVGVQYRSQFGLDLSSDFNYTHSQTWEDQAFTLTATGATAGFVSYDLPSYYTLNARVGYRLLDDDLELGFSGVNLTNNRHREHPFGQEIGMRLMGTVAYRF